jgi:hypothetical protein
MTETTQPKHLAVISGCKSLADLTTAWDKATADLMTDHLPKGISVAKMQTMCQQVDNYRNNKMSNAADAAMAFVTQTNNMPTSEQPLTLTLDLFGSTTGLVTIADGATTLAVTHGWKGELIENTMTKVETFWKTANIDKDEEAGVLVVN